MAESLNSNVLFTRLESREHIIQNQRRESFKSLMKISISQEDSGYMNVLGNVSSEMSSSNSRLEDSLSQSINSDVSHGKSEQLTENCSEDYSQSASLLYNLLGKQGKINDRERTPIPLVC